MFERQPDLEHSHAPEPLPGATEPARMPERLDVGDSSWTWHARIGLLLVRIYGLLEANTFIPWWLPPALRRKRVGYLAAALAQVAMTVATVALIRIFPSFTFVGILHFLVVALIALSWGAVPALVATAAGAALLEVTLFLPPISQPLHPGGDLAEILTFLGAGIVVGIAASLTEGERRRAVIHQARSQAAEMGLREANRRMDEFLALVTHELKSPLSGIQLASQLARRSLTHLLRGETTLSPEGAERLEKSLGLLDQVQRQTSLQNRLIGDLLDISRIQSDRLELAKEPCDLVEIVTQAVEDQRLAWPGREITVTIGRCALDGTLPIVADAERIGQVISNYLTNALKYSADDKPVRVGVRCDNRCARVAVRDEGPGLPPAEQKRIWERFYRADGIEIQSGSGVGLGMGLHICKTLIERHGGRVGIESTPGYGSTFYFTLPLGRSK
jgi:signal transduction histidine kinase